MFRWLTVRLRGKRRRSTDQERAEEEAIRRQAEQERMRAEARMAEERARIESAGHGFPGGW